MRRIDFKIVAMSAMAVVIISCKKQDTAGVDGGEYFLKVRTEASERSKTSIEGSNWGKDINWNEKDQISLYSPSSDTYIYTLKEGAGTTSGLFSTKTKPDFKKDDSFAAFYPAAIVSDKDGSRTLSWPSEQTRVLYHPEIVELPLIAEGEIEDGAPADATFNCLGGVLDVILKVPADGQAGYLRKVVITTNEKISGEFSVETANGKKVAVIDASKGSNKITYTLEGNGNRGMYIKKGDDVEHHLMIAMPASPADGYTGFQMDFYDQNDTRISGVSSKKNLIIERAKVTTANVPFSHVYAPGLTMNSPEGTIGELYGVQAIVIEIGGVKRALAMENVGATETNPYGTKFDFDSDHNPTPSLDLKDGWRLPYYEEWEAISRKYCPYSDLEEGTNMYPMIVAGKTVKLPCAYYQYYAGMGEGCAFFIQDANTYRYALVGYTCGSLTSAYVRPIRELPFYPAIDPDHEITPDDPVGSIGMLKGREAVVMNLRGYKVAVATTNVGGSTPKDSGNIFYFSNQEQKGWNYDGLNLKDGWRLPSPQEWMEIFDDYSHLYNYVDDDDREEYYYEWILSDQSRLQLAQVEKEGYVSCESYYSYMFGAKHADTHLYSGGDARAYARPIYSLNPITKDSPVGTEGVVDGRECVVVYRNSDKSKVLVSVNNPGPANDNGASTDAANYTSYARGYYMTNEKADECMSQEGFGKGWTIPTEKDMLNIPSSNMGISYDSGNNRIDVKITDSYTWHWYAGGYKKVHDGSPINPNDFCYRYIKKNHDPAYGYTVVKFEDGKYDHLEGILWAKDDERNQWMYPVILTHEMPN